VSEAGKKIKAAMEMESAGLDHLLADMESNAGVEGALAFAKVLLLRDRCAMLLLAMTIEGVGENLDEVKSLAQQLLAHDFDMDALTQR
jgi:hypothetical protein